MSPSEAPAKKETVDEAFTRLTAEWLASLTAKQQIQVSRISSAHVNAVGAKQRRKTGRALRRLYDKLHVPTFADAEEAIR